MNYGVQLFGVLNNLKGRQPDEIFRELHNAGVAFVEPCITMFPIPGLDHAFWTVDSFHDLYLPLLKKNGLGICSVHLASQNLLADLPRIRELAIHDGIYQFVVKSPQSLSKEKLQQTAIEYASAANKMKEFGAELLLHNELTDAQTIIDGKTAYEYLADLCLGNIGLQVDAGWLLAAGVDPESFLWSNRERVRSVHYKDFLAGTETMIGKGDLQIEPVFQFARAFGLPQILDQDQSSDILSDITAVTRKLHGCEGCRSATVSYLNILDTETGEIKTLRRFDDIIEAPSWKKNSDTFLYNADGRIWEYDPVSDGTHMIDTGECDACNNDHVLSPDEKRIGVSHMTFGGEGFTSRIYTMPAAGGEPELITPNTPSFLHGWSPDGKELSYCAFREINGKREVDIYTIPAEGGEEKRITNEGFNDGPEYSPDGAYIWFNSTRSGLMQIWRIRTDGSECTQMTDNERNNWFPHISPDGKKVVYISYRKGDLKPDEHLPNMTVEIWRMDADGSHKEKLITFLGGQGSMNVNSWAADSRRIAFISYELMHKQM